MNLAQFRQQYPQFNKLNDAQLAQLFHEKYYADVPFRSFAKAIGLQGFEDLRSDPTEGMSGLEKFAAGYGKAGSDIVSGVGQRIGQALPKNITTRLGLPTEEDIDASKALDAPLMNTGAGMVGNIAGNVAAMLPLAVLPGANTVAGGTAYGSLAGAALPTGSDDSALLNTALGGVFGAAVPAVVGAGRAAQAASDPLLNQDRVISGALFREVGQNDAQATAAALRGRGAATPGVSLSAGETSGSEALSAVEDALRAQNPGGSLARAAGTNRRTLADVLRGLAQDDAAMEAAVAARRKATAPLYTAASQSENLVDPSRTVHLLDRMLEANPANSALTSPLRAIRESLFESYPEAQRATDAWKVLNDLLQSPRFRPLRGNQELRLVRTLMDRVKKGTITAQDALVAMRGVQGANKTFAAAIDHVKALMKTPDFVLRQKPRHIMSALDNIDAMLGKQENAFVRRELLAIKQSLSNQLRKVAPEYNQAEQVFAQLSRPVNQMQIGRKLADTLIPATAGENPAALNAASLARAMRNPDQVAKLATGFKRARMGNILSTDQMGAVQGVTADASRIAESMRRGAGYGSPTARRLAAGDVLGEHISQNAGIGPVTAWIMDMTGRVPGVGGAVRATTGMGRTLADPIKRQIAARMDELLATNPQAVAQMLEQELARLTPPQQQALLQALPANVLQRLPQASVMGLSAMAVQQN